MKALGPVPSGFPSAAPGPSWNACSSACSRPERMCQVHASRFARSAVQAVIGSVPSSKHSRMELKQRMGNRMERSGMGLETPSWAARSRVTLEAGLENRMERFLRSRDGGRADERSKRFRETATRICAPPERTSPRRPPRQCPGRRPRTPTASPQGKIRPPVPRPRTGGSALIPASSAGSASAPRPSTRGAPPSHRRSTSS